MPRVVDHDERREEIVAAAGRVIAREGLEATTVRRIAVEAGYSSGVLDHYFHGKDDILVQALQLSHQRIRGRVGRSLHAQHGLAALRTLLVDNLPLDEGRGDETRLELNFWSRSLADPELALVQRREAVELRDALHQRVREAQAAGELDPAASADDVTERLHALVDGLSVHALLYPDRLPSTRQLALLDQELESLRPTPRGLSPARRARRREGRP